MPEAGNIRDIILTTVSEVFEAHGSRLRNEVVQQVIERLQAPTAGLEQLSDALACVEESSTQSDVLARLLDGAAAFSVRSAVFLVRSNSAGGWLARGFPDNEAIRLLTLDLNSGLAEKAIQERTLVQGSLQQPRSQFVAQMSAPHGDCILMPLVVREKVVALIYADGGSVPGGMLEASGIRILTRMAALWLEVLALRKATGVGVAQPSNVATDVSAESGLQQPSMEVPPPVSEVPPPVSEPAPVPAEPADPATPVVADDELHRKARRFARLLVDEIKLYNLAKVRDGKLHHNLYERLKDDIEKSRSTYDKRYANTPAASADYFTQELLLGLADGDSTLFGSNFPR